MTARRTFQATLLLVLGVASAGCGGGSDPPPPAPQPSSTTRAERSREDDGSGLLAGTRFVRPPVVLLLQEQKPRGENERAGYLVVVRLDREPPRSGDGDLNFQLELNELAIDRTGRLGHRDRHCFSTGVGVDAPRAHGFPTQPGATVRVRARAFPTGTLAATVPLTLGRVSSETRGTIEQEALERLECL